MASEIDDPKGFALWRIQTIRKAVGKREEEVDFQRELLEIRVRKLEQERAALAKMEAEFKKIFGEDPPPLTY